MAATFAATMIAAATLAAPPSGEPLTVGGPGVLLDLNRSPGIVRFDATAGQRLTVLAQRRTLTAADNTDLVIQRDGAGIAEGTLLTTWSEVSVDFTAPAAGGYTVRVAPRAAKDRGALMLHLVGATTGDLTIGGPTRKISIGRPGERAFLTFPATAGQRLTLVAWRGTLPKDEYTHLEVRGPSGEVATAGAVGYDSDYRTLDFDVTKSGRHTIEINPDTVHTGTLTVQLTGTVAATITPGRPATITVGRPGERAYLTFRAAEAEQFHLVARRGTLTTTEQTRLRVRTPSGLDVADGVLDRTKATTTLGFSSSAGVYTAEIDPEGLDTGTLTVELRRLP